MIVVSTLKEVIKLRREVEELLKELKEFIEGHSIEGKIETVCETPRIAFMCVPMGCVIHVLDGGRARYTIMVSDRLPKALSATLIDWLKHVTTVLADEDLSKVLKEMGAEEDLKICVERYISSKKDLLSKLTAIKAVLEIA
jgi:hypothetical protein